MSFTINTFTVSPLKIEQRRHLVRPFMRWVGGKQRLVGSLLERLPPADSYSTYYEPFLGAGSLFLAGNFKQAHLNDLNYHLINTYCQVRDRHEELYDMVRYHADRLEIDHKTNFGEDWKNYTKERSKASYYYRIRKEYNSNLNLSDDAGMEAFLEQAARFLFLIHSNYNGVFRVNKKGEYNVPFGKKLTRVPSLELLGQISDKLQGAELTTLSFDELEIANAAEAFVYLDPPYPSAQPHDLFNQQKPSLERAFTSYNAPPFGIEEHEKLSDFANDIRERGAKVMVSIAEPHSAPETDQRRIQLREWYPEKYWTYHSTKYKRTIGPKKDAQVVQELILTSYKPKSPKK